MIIDEVLAVGDAEFQKKCLSKMSDVAHAGRTVLFVSHNMNAVQQLCNRVIRLVSGRLDSDTADVRAGVLGYLTGTGPAGSLASWVNPGNKFEADDFKPLSVGIVDENGVAVTDNLHRGTGTYVEITGLLRHTNSLLKIGYVLIGSDGAQIYESVHTDAAMEQWPQMLPGVVKLRSRLPIEILNEGAHHLDLAISIHAFKWICEPRKSAPSITFNVMGPLSDSPYWRERREGAIGPQLRWAAIQTDAAAFTSPTTTASSLVSEVVA